MDKAQGQLQKAKTVGILANRFETYAYKPKKKEVTVPFGVEVNMTPLLSEIVASVRCFVV
jgi:hypothetical protein